MPRKPNPVKSRVVHVLVPVTDLDLFNRIYPSCLSNFVRRAIRLAVNDKKSFDNIFFDSYTGVD